MTKRTTHSKFSRISLLSALGAMALATIGGAALAQRDPVYEAARANGQVGEKMDGYLGIVGTETTELRRMVADINIKRKAVYTTRAQAQNSTLEEYAFTAGCLQIDRTVPGEIYQAPDGSWKTRTAAPPLRDPRCP